MWRVPNTYIWHKAEGCSPSRHEAVWSVSYADLMTLLLCFFVVILMVSPPPVARGGKVHSVMASLRAAFGTAVDKKGVRDTGHATLVEQLVAATQTEGGGEAELAGSRTLSLSHEADGLHMTIRGEYAFADRSAAVLTGEADKALRRMAAALRELSPRVEVRAYMSSGNPSGNVAAGAGDARAKEGFDDGVARGRAVSDVLAQCGLPIDRLQIMAAGGVMSVGSGRAAPPGDVCRVEVIVQAQGERSTSPTAARDSWTASE